MKKYILFFFAAIVAAVAIGQTDKVIQLFKNDKVVQQYSLDEIDYLEVKDVIGTPKNVTATVNNGKVTVSWSAVEGAENYTIFRSDNASNNFTEVAHNIVGTSWIDNNPLNGSNYYKVQAHATGKVSLAMSSAAGAVLGNTGMDSGIYNGHEYVDLGLPSGLKWATCNVGATKPEEYGDYFAWGETSTKSSYYEDNCTTYGKIIYDISGNPSYDAARKNWGGTWRMPTKTEIEELINNITTKWTTMNGVYGLLVTSKINGNSIFLPAAGCRDGSSLYGTGEYGYFWSSTPCESSSYGAYGLYFYFGYFYWSWNLRNYGQSVRAVTE